MTFGPRRLPIESRPFLLAPFAFFDAKRDMMPNGPPSGFDAAVCLSEAMNCISNGSLVEPVSRASEAGIRISTTSRLRNLQRYAAMSVRMGSSNLSRMSPHFFFSENNFESFGA